MGSGGFCACSGPAVAIGASRKHSHRQLEKVSSANGQGRGARAAGDVSLAPESRPTASSITHFFSADSGHPAYLLSVRLQPETEAYLFPHLSRDKDALYRAATHIGWRCKPVSVEG